LPPADADWPGGIGKTRLALEAARLITEENTPSLDFPNGVYFVPLQPLTSAANFSTRAIEQSSAPIVNPFAEYSDVFPGQPKSAATAHGFSCPAGTYGSPQEYCFLHPATGIFSQVGVKVSGGIIRQIDFILRDYNLRLGNLILLWGMPQHTAWNIAWPAIGVMAATHSSSERVSPMLVVRQVFFTE
jgi:hypothetical protein